MMIFIEVLGKIDIGQSSFNDVTLWYLALAYWEKGEKEKAMEIFQQISKDTGAFNQQMASDVLSRYIH